MTILAAVLIAAIYVGLCVAVVSNVRIIRRLEHAVIESRLRQIQSETIRLRLALAGKAPR